MDAIQAGNLNAGLAEEDLQIKAGDKLSDQLNAFSLELDELKKSQSNSFTEKLTAEIEAKLAGLSDKAEEEVSGLKDRIGKIVDDALTGAKTQGIFNDAIELWDQKQRKHRYNFRGGIAVFIVILFATGLLSWWYFDGLNLLIDRVTIGGLRVLAKLVM